LCSQDGHALKVTKVTPLGTKRDSEEKERARLSSRARLFTVMIFLLLLPVKGARRAHPNEGMRNVHVRPSRDRRGCARCILYDHDPRRNLAVDIIFYEREGYAIHGVEAEADFAD
jgi:hypothetical protein